MPYWDDGSGQSKSQYDSSGGYDNTGNQNNNSPQTIAKKAPPKKPKVTKDNKVSEGFLKNYLRYHPVYSTLNKLSKSKFSTNVNAKRRQKYLENLKEEDIDAYNQTVGDLEKVNYVKRGLEYYGPKSKGAARDIETFTDLGEEQALEILGQRYKDTLPTFNNNNSGDNPQPYIPINYNTGAGTTEDEYTNDFTYRLSDGSQNVIYDNYGDPGYRNTRAEGGIMGTRARRAMGGIMSRVDQRQGYFLGKIVKGVKSAIGGVADAAGKVLKSDLGKAALLAAGTYYAGGGFGRLSGGFKFGNIPGASFLMGGGKDGKYDGGFNPFKVGALGLGALSLFGNKAAPNKTSFSDRGGSLRNSQGQEGQQAIRDEIYDAYENKDQDKIASLQRYYGYKLPALNAVADLSLPSSLPYRNYAQGGRIGKAEGGLMDLGGMEKDYRAEGGFVPIGEYEKKDDVPARLSVNEFVFTADAVRGAGQGDIDKGAEIMENMMENLENGGTVSEESQGNKGAQQMFETSERLGAVI
jgi:hypothetical protein